MAKPARLEPTVFLAMISPITVGLVAGVVALVVLMGAPWWAAALAGLAVWIVRVLISRRIAHRLRALPRRIDPFALREPWRFYVRDALQARSRFSHAIDGTPDGPLRERLLEIGDRITTGVEEFWEVAQRGQRLTDARRAVKLDRVRRTLDDADSDDPRRASAEAQLASHERLAAREQETQQRLDLLDSRLEEAVVRAAELGTRTTSADELDRVADAVDGIVGALESLRLGLDDVGGP